MAIVARDFERLEKKSCGICDNDFSALPENISQGLVAIVTRHFESVEKNLVATDFEAIQKMVVADVTMII